MVLSENADDEFEDRADLAETLAMIRRSEADIEAGRVRDAHEAIRGIAKKHGLSLER